MKRSRIAFCENYALKLTDNYLEQYDLNQHLNSKSDMPNLTVSEIHCECSHTLIMNILFCLDLLEMLLIRLG